MKNPTSTLLVFASMGHAALALPKWSDIFASLKPYEDPSEVDVFDFEEAGQPRFGIVQLSTGTTTYNATLNLTGHILLGLGIASSVLLYMFFQAFKGSDSGGYAAPSDGYGKRSFFNEDEAEELLMTRIPILLTLLDHQMEKLGLEEEHCRLRVSCQIGRQNKETFFDKNFGENEKSDASTRYDMVQNEGVPNHSMNVTMSKALMELFTHVSKPMLSSKLPETVKLEDHYKAFEEGKNNQDCKRIFPNCKLSKNNIDKILNTII